MGATSGGVDEYTESAALKGLWATLPDMPLTHQEGVRVAKKLYRFALGITIDDSAFIHRQGTERVYYHFDVLGHCNKLRLPQGHDAWRRLVYTMGHMCARIYYRDHVTTTWQQIDDMRLKMTKEVIKRDWLGGVLQRAPKPPPTKEEKMRARVKRVNVLIKQWQTKKTRADNAIYKLVQERNRIERRLSK